MIYLYYKLKEKKVMICELKVFCKFMYLSIIKLNLGRF